MQIFLKLLINQLFSKYKSVSKIASMCSKSALYYAANLPEPRCLVYDIVTDLAPVASHKHHRVAMQLSLPTWLLA